MERKVQVEAAIKEKTESYIKMEIKIPYTKSMIESEELIQIGLNAAGLMASEEIISSFDTDGSNIKIGTIKFTNKGKVVKEYETPYGSAKIERYVYQTSKGGATYCPLDESARIIGSATPKFAKMISNKYSRNVATEVQSDFKSNHNRHVSRGLIQEVSENVSEIAKLKEDVWEYNLPEKKKETPCISLGMDGAMMLMRKDGYREAMVGSIALYDSKGERQHSIYVAGSPEYGKSKFIKNFEKEIENIKNIYPDATYVGIADGAHTNWKFLEDKTDTQITDFYHATEYLAEYSRAIFIKNQESKRKEWLEDACHELKHTHGAVDILLKEFELSLNNKKLSGSKKGVISSVITYFTNQKSRMQYAKYRGNNLPIGSGITEAACKTIVKHRLCSSGMRWKDKGASVVLKLRCLDKSNRWELFWDKINQYPLPKLN